MTKFLHKGITASYCEKLPNCGLLQHPHSRRYWLGSLAGAGAEAGDDRGQAQVLGISKRSNGYLRKMLVHGARAALRMLSGTDTALGRWLRGLLQRAHKNTVVVALAAKLARVACAVLRSGRGFEVGAATVS
jgi:hypothetical protein